MNSFELLKALKQMGYIKDKRDEYWWPKSGTFDVVVGAILTQQARWEKVEKSLDNLRKNGYLNLNALADISADELALLIKDSGFYNMKAKRLKLLSKNIQENFGDFETFQNGVDREWLLKQKGIGQESADSILCYACYKEAMVVDSYTARVLSFLGYEFEEYGQIQEWLVCGLEENIEKIYELYKEEISLEKVYARFHGKIVEFLKEYKKDLAPLREFI